MSTKIAINGFGRIGRLPLRAMLERHKQELTVVAVNDMADLQTNAHLFRYDSIYGIFPRRIETGEGVLKIDDWEIMVLNQKDPSRLPWRALGVDIVIESTGVFTDAAWPVGLPWTPMSFENWFRSIDLIGKTHTKMRWLHL